MDFRTNVIKTVTELFGIQKEWNLVLILGKNKKEKEEREEQGKRVKS